MVCSGTEYCYTATYTDKNGIDQRPVVRRVDSVIYRIAIFLNFIKNSSFTGVYLTKVRYFKVKVSFY